MRANICLKRTFTFLICIFFSNIYAQNIKSDSFPDSLLQDSSRIILKVGIKSSPPFVFQNEQGNWDGISVYLWEEIADKLDWQYEYVEHKNLAALIGGLDEKRIDLTINPLTVTSARIKHISFTQPFFIANSVIVTKVKPKEKYAGWLGKVFSWRFIQSVFLLFFVVFLGGFMVWWLEHKKNPQFPAGWPGLWSGIWWSAATMTTVGYGDKAPQTVPGQIVGFIWMFATILMISGFMASIASALTVDQLDDEWKDINHLRHVRVGSVSKSASRSFLSANMIRSNEYEDMHQGLKSLKGDRIDAFVYDEPILRYEIDKDSLNEDIRVLPFRFNTQYYSFGLPKGSRLAEKINPALLQFIEDVRWKALLTDYDLVEF